MQLVNGKIYSYTVPHSHSRCESYYISSMKWMFPILRGDSFINTYALTKKSWYMT